MSSALELKKIYYCAALISLTFSWPLYGLDLGKTSSTKVLVAKPDNVEQSISSSTDFIAPIGLLGQQDKPESEFLKKSNALLQKQLSLFQDQNGELQDQIEKRDKDVELIRQQLNKMITQTGPAVQMDHFPLASFSSSWLIRLVLLLGIALGGSCWYFASFRQKRSLMPVLTTAPHPVSAKIESVNERKSSVNKPITSFSTVPLVEDSQALQTEETADPLKSKKAFATLIELAKTYISMADFDSARQALEEVQEHGTKSQQKEATDILLQLQDRKN